MREFVENVKQCTKENMEKNNKLSVVEELSLVIKKELSNEAVSRALLSTTFKGLEVTSMKQALLEGLIRGYTFQDFLKKDVYAIPFGKGYSLVTSIDNSRKLAMRTGQYCGKTAPIFTYKDNGDIESCSVTVKKNTGGVIGEFTAEVYFDEYTKKRDLWVTKPKTMIAKVAEMHALRMAFPEELAKEYIEEEVGVVEDTRVIDIREKLVDNDLSMGNFVEKNNDKKENNNEEASVQISEEDTGEDSQGFADSLKQENR